MCYPGGYLVKNQLILNVHLARQADLLRKLIGNFKIGICINCFVGEVIRILLCEFGSLSLHLIVLVEVTSHEAQAEGSSSLWQKLRPSIAINPT